MTANSRRKQLYDHISDMEPLLPGTHAELPSLTVALVRSAERLRTALHPVTRKEVAGLVRSMNSYYSNLIEGHRTKPRDIDAALTKHFSTDPTQRSLQMQHLAHMEVQADMETRLQSMQAGDICATEFLCWLHEGFYRRLPAEFHEIEDGKGSSHKVQPGQLRDCEVSVGCHVAPSSRKLDGFLKRFAEFYGPLVTADPSSLIAAAAAHHRLAWVHPFLDGNGRVARLFTHAWFAKAGIDGDGLWTISRGLARRREEYRATLANADQKRLNDYDGRGYLSQRYLGEFCQFFLRTAIDQVEFMQELLALDGMQARILGYAERKESAKELPVGSGLILREIFLRGEIARGELSRIVGASPRTGQKITGELLSQRLVASSSPKGPLHLDFPADAAGYYFPNLYPAGMD